MLFGVGFGPEGGEVAEEFGGLVEVDSGRAGLEGIEFGAGLGYTPIIIGAGVDAFGVEFGEALDFLLEAVAAALIGLGIAVGAEMVQGAGRVIVGNLDAGKKVGEAGLERAGVDELGVGAVAAIVAVGVAVVAGVEVAAQGLAAQGAQAMRADAETGEGIDAGVEFGGAREGAAGAANRLGLVEFGPGDEGRVRAGVQLALIADLADVERVLQHRADGVFGEWGVVAGAIAFVVEPAGDVEVGIEAGDELGEGELKTGGSDGIGFGGLAVGADLVSPGEVAVPVALFGAFTFALLNFGREVFEEEFGEGGEHDEHEPALGGGEVELFGDRAVGDVEFLEFVEVDEGVDQVPGKSVHLVGEEHVGAALADEGEGFLEALAPVVFGAFAFAFKDGDDLPAARLGELGAEVALGVEAVACELFFGRDADVDDAAEGVGHGGEVVGWLGGSHTTGRCRGIGI